MAFSLVAHDKIAGAQNGGTSATFDSTGATLLVLAVCYYSSGGALTVSDSKGNTWTAGTPQTNPNGKIVLYYSMPTSVGTGHTVTVTGTGIYSVTPFIAASGLSPTFGAEGGATGTGTSLATGSFTPASDNMLVVCAIVTDDGSSAHVVPSGFTMTDHADFTTNFNEGGALAYQIQTTKTAVNPSWSWTSAANAAVVWMTFGLGSSSSGGAGSSAIQPSSVQPTSIEPSIEESSVE